MADPIDPIIEIGGLKLQPGDRIGSWVYVRPIGVGGMATVVLARDPNDDPVAIKILKASRIGTTAARRFHREFRALSRVRHPNVIRVDAFGDIHGHPFIVMEYVEGEDLHQEIRGFRHLEKIQDRWTRTEAILIDLCRALAHVHQKGLVHRDLKPSNVLIDREGRAKLTDFGIVKDLDPGNDGFQSGTLVGTWAYASPEQISGEPIDHRSDLYSLGIILFAMLTGSRPFDEKDMKGYLDAHRNKAPPRAVHYDHRIPPHLDEICAHLLQKNPRDRFQSAREILYRLEQLEPEDAMPAAGAGQLALPLVGRAAEVEALQGAVDRLTRREGGMVVIEGSEGMGKTRLLEAVQDRASTLGIPVHVLEAAKGPAELFGLLDLCVQVQEALGERAPEALGLAIEEWRQGAARGGDALYRLVDQLRPAIVRLLADGPRILLYDDFHALPPRGMELMASLVRAIIVPGEPLCLVLTARSEAIKGSVEVFLRGEEMGLTPTWIRLEPLPGPALRRLVEGQLGPGRPAELLADRLHAETQGNPLFVVQFLESLVQRGVLVPGMRGGLELTVDAEEVARGHLEIPQGVRQVVRVRLEHLQSGQRAILEVLSVAGRPLELDILLDVLDADDEEEVLDAIDGLIARGVVVERRAGGLVLHHFAHRLVADVVYRDLAVDRRARLHRSMALALEERFASHPSAVELVGDHYRLAGEAGKAYAYLVAAAERMRSRALVAPTWDLCTSAAAVEELASVSLGDSFADLRARLLILRAEILYLRGQFEDGLRLAEALGDDQRGLVLRSSALLRLGRTDAAQAAAEAALQAARRGRDRGQVARALSARASVAWEAGEGADAERWAEEGLVLAQGEDLAGVRAELLLALSAVQAAAGQLASATKGLEEAEPIFNRLGEKPERCLALCNLGEILLWQGHPGLARARALDALRVAEEIGYRLGRAAALRVLAETALDLGQYAACRKDLDTALAEANALAVHTEMISTRFALARLCAAQGDAAGVDAHTAIARNLALRRDPEHSLPVLVALAAWACAASGDTHDAVRMLEAAEKNLDKLPITRRAQVLVESAHARATLGQPEQAQRLAMDAATLARSRGLRLLDLEARRILWKLAPDEASGAAWKGDVEALAELVHQELGQDQARAFRERLEAEL